MTPPPTNIDGTDITGATIDATEVQEITIDGQTVFTAGPVPVNSAPLDEGSGSTFADTAGSANGTLTSNNWRFDSRFEGGTAPDLTRAERGEWQPRSQVPITITMRCLFDTNNTEDFFEVFSWNIRPRLFYDNRGEFEMLGNGSKLNVNDSPQGKMRLFAVRLDSSNSALDVYDENVNKIGGVTSSGDGRAFNGSTMYLLSRATQGLGVDGSPDFVQVFDTFIQDIDSHMSNVYG